MAEKGGAYWGNSHPPLTPVTIFKSKLKPSAFPLRFSPHVLFFMGAFPSFENICSRITPPLPAIL